MAKSSKPLSLTDKSKACADSESKKQSSSELNSIVESIISTSTKSDLDKESLPPLVAEKPPTRPPSTSEDWEKRLSKEWEDSQIELCEEVVHQLLMLKTPSNVTERIPSAKELYQAMVKARKGFINWGFAKSPPKEVVDERVQPSLSTTTSTEDTLPEEKSGLDPS
jgi:hypothetical protein